MDAEHVVTGPFFVDGVTNFAVEHFIDLLVKLGVATEGVAIMYVHPVVLTRMLNNNLLDFIPAVQWVGRRPSDVPILLGIELRIWEKELDRGDGCFATRIVVGDGRNGELVTREM